MNSSDFRKFLTEIFDHDIVNGFLEENSSNFKEFAHIINFINNFKIHDNNQGCQKCLKIYNKILPGEIQNFNIRNMDFPAWLGELNFNKVHRKEIMILGESVTNTYQKENIPNTSLFLSKERKINLAFGLGTIIREINDLPKINNKSKNGAILFWKKITILLQHLKENWLERLYISDIARCNCNKIPYLYYPCGMAYLIKELEFINPKIIFLLGNHTNDAFISIIQSSDNYFINPIEIKGINFPYYSPNKLTSGYVIHKNLKDQSMIFLSIPHTAQTSPNYQEISFWECLASYIKNNYIQIFKNFS